MKNKFVTVYGIVALLILALAVSWFAVSISAEMKKGAVEAERSFSWITRTMELSAVTEGFMSDGFVARVTNLCRQSRSLAAITVTTPSGVVFAWPDGSSMITYGDTDEARLSDPSLFTRSFSAKLDISDSAGSTVLVTAVLHVLHPSAIFAASRISFLVTLALVLVTFIVIIAVTPAPGDAPHERRRAVASVPKARTRQDHDFSILDDTAVAMPDFTPVDAYPVPVPDGAGEIPEPPSVHEDDFTVADGAEAGETVSAEAGKAAPEGLFSPVSGIGWEQYLPERLDAELVRAASSEQDLALVVMRVSGLLHTDLLSRKIAQILLDTFKFRDMVFEFGADGFAAIMQNVNLDQMMKTADCLYADVDALLMELGYEGRITVGITTRTARLLPAKRMIEEAVNAAKKAEEEPSLPIVAFRANPDKYRNYIAEKC